MLTRRPRRAARTPRLLAGLLLALTMGIAPAQASAAGGLGADDPLSCSDIIVIGGGGFGIGTDISYFACGVGSTAPGSACTFEPVTLIPLGFGLGGLLPGMPLPFLDTYLWFLATCPNNGQALLALPFGLSIVDGVIVSPWMLVEDLLQALTLPKPSVRFNPEINTATGVATLVNLPTWWWVENWAPELRVAAWGPVWVELTAGPLYSEWKPGNGRPAVRCDGPGIPWQPDLDDDDPRACTYTYPRSSASSATDRYTATVTVTYGLSWEGSGGLSGTLPLVQTSSSVPIGVAERQALVISTRE